MEERLYTPRDAPADGGQAARYLAVERQKQELRRERDRVLLGLAGELGENGAADALGVRRQDIGRLLAGARERLDARGTELATAPLADVSAQRGSARRAPRRGPDTGRWAEADAWYESLGRAPLRS